MFFEDSQKLIFSPTCDPTKKYDPLALDRALRKESKNQLSRLIDTWQAVNRDEGDVSEEGMYKTAIASDEAEEALANIARTVFGLPLFPECTDGVALEYLCEYLDWCKKKEMNTIISQDSSTLGVTDSQFSHTQI